MATYLTEEQNVADLINQIPQQDRAAFAAMKASRVEAAFAGRYLVLFKPHGLNRDGSHRAPEVLTTLRFSGFFCDDIDGADVEIYDTRAKEKMTVGHVPTRVFDYELFIHIPPVYRMRWDARETDHGTVRSLVFPVVIFSRNRSSFYSAGVTYAETPNRFREMFPDHKIDLHFD